MTTKRQRWVKANHEERMEIIMENMERRKKRKAILEKISNIVAIGILVVAFIVIVLESINKCNEYRTETLDNAYYVTELNNIGHKAITHSVSMLQNSIETDESALEELVQVERIEVIGDDVNEIRVHSKGIELYLDDIEIAKMELVDESNNTYLDKVTGIYYCLSKVEKLEETEHGTILHTELPEGNFATWDTELDARTNVCLLRIGTDQYNQIMTYAICAYGERQVR